MTTPARPPLRGYLLLFVAGFLGSALLLGVLAHFFPRVVSTGTGAITLLIGALLAIQHFLKDQRRLPDRSEKRRLLWGSWAIAMLLQTAVLLVLTHAMPLGSAFALWLLTALITLAIIAFTYSDWYARILLRGIEKRRASK